MTTSAKVLQVLRLFTQGRKQLCITDVIELLDVSQATAYRYLVDLEEAGMIERANPNQYVLGPTVVELDRQVRIHDPLIAASAEIMKNLSERIGGTALLSRLHGRRVMCVHQTTGRFSPVSVSYERGRAMPMYRGATSKIILASLDPASLRDIVRQDAGELRQAGLPATFEALNAFLATIRSAGVCHASGEIDKDVVAWATAIHHGKTLLGSLSVVIDRNAPIPEIKSVADKLVRAALRIESRLELPTRTRPPRGSLE
ncbi:MAG: helix-turn-helix domain-containing protein [Pseudomonadota bacterium]